MEIKYLYITCPLYLNTEHWVKSRTKAGEEQQQIAIILLTLHCIFLVYFSQAFQSILQQHSALINEVSKVPFDVDVIKPVLQVPKQKRREKKCLAQHYRFGSKAGN